MSNTMIQSSGEYQQNIILRSLFSKDGSFIGGNVSPDITNIISRSGMILPPTLVLNTFSFFFQIGSFGNILLLLLLSQFLQVELCHPKREVEVLKQ